MLIIPAEELAQDLAQDQSTVEARNVKNFLHLLQSQNVIIMLNKPHDHGEKGHEDFKCDPITKNILMKSVNQHILFLQNIFVVLVFCFHLFQIC